MKQQHTCQPRDGWRGLLGHLNAKRLDKLAVLHARGARGFSCAAIEAQIEMAPYLIVERYPTIGDGSHEIDAPTRAIVLIAEFNVSGASRCAKPAMHAVEEQLVVDVCHCLLFRARKRQLS